jgi:hypothetical protein
MSEKIPLRTWATPLIMGAFLLMAATGMLMFFELDRGVTTVVHQWFSWLLVAGAVAHITANFRPFKNHLKSSWGRVTVIVSAIILMASFFSWGIVTGPQLERPIEEALVDAPLSALANVTRTDADALVRQLKRQGIIATRDQSIREVANTSGVGENRLLAIVFLKLGDP